MEKVDELDNALSGLKAWGPAEAIKTSGKWKPDQTVSNTLNPSAREAGFEIFNADCLDAERRIPDKSVTLGIFDPPFGLGEADFDKHYNRNSGNVLKGYVEAPRDYARWTRQWLTEARRVLRDDGSMYVFSGYSNLRHVLNAADDLNLRTINHIVWKYNFGVYTTRKFVTSHYHVLYYAKSNRQPVFNTHCRFGPEERDGAGRSLLYKDLEDVFVVNREYAPRQQKNQNKLPEALVRKIIQYSSSAGDTVCDFFMGNFTTAYAAIKLGRRVVGYELNRNAYQYHMPLLKEMALGCDLEPRVAA